MPDYRTVPADTHRQFRRIRRPRRFHRTERHLPSGLLLKEYEFLSEDRKGKTLLFFTDLHLRFSLTRNLFGGGGPPFWRGSGWIASALREATEMLHPDYLLFGGDLVTYTECYPAAMRMMAELRAPGGCFAVPGNWDKRRRRWLPFREIERRYEQAGWRLLVNEEIRDNALLIYGTDDYKIGIPRVYDTRAKTGFRVLLSHNPDTVAELPEEEIGPFDLALCGHTHGGQIRLPGFGALRASSRYWKRFEYGFYERKGGNTAMIVSSGIGATWIPVRIHCPPEAVLVRF